MANEENLKGHGFDERTASEQRKIAQKGGIVSGQVRRQKKAFRELFEQMLSEDGGTLNGQQVSRKDMVTARAIKMLTSDKTKDQDFLRAFEIVRDTIGEKPVEKVVVSEVSQEVIDEVEKIVNEIE